MGPLWASAVREVLTAAGFDIIVVTLPAGEVSKTTETWTRCVDALLDAGIDRRTPVVALGGGVLGDVAGFAAATVLRGVPFVQLPTTLLAMVDASVGGKTGVNHPSGKNLVGAFHQPVLVYAALGTLATLPAAERIAGLGEVVKTALIGDRDLLARIEEQAEALREGDVSALAPVIARCVEIKAAVVGRDERESGWRAVLNAGHTLGHAWEAASGFGVLRHGEAVALGLLAETRWAVRRGYCQDPELPRRLAELLHRLGLPTEPPTLPRDRLLGAMRVDKKARGDILLVPVAVRAGQAVLAELPVQDLIELLPEPR
ncbi:MAG: 3-dehydroquinate synthase [Deltaproteobacteria bacterium]|nr:3-dehydroquinate synthase [Deltaproteobacteria bacterium]